MASLRAETRRTTFASLAACLSANTFLELAGGAAAFAQQPPAPTIEKLIGEGWEIAGYISARENRSLILFKHKEHRFLVQCSILTDVLRDPRIVMSCHELR
ncbi:MAG TPA: hypothetical protein VJ740_02580 [Hyphomicrobiaceae bacterium]|jgi:hypothetical protein|nr:hypothetical protein [Hyphomicrobiaceae bacterium]